ncbi:ABC transporter substrate-binding protein [Feifania hominis]|uniref:ABC transporter substrate-binding protein n=1 Tax=Feifania hominis TaxID=2763660 RepID=A0A926DF17_9FIRM|nr:ABC transporter substrate-binding protein [Feifania hominis]MBC8536953.1 ABC transporter substrate-binding protein [Feifania hominis]
MKAKVKILALTVCLALILTAFAGCQKKEESRTVRLAEVTHSIFYAPQYVAINEGYFAKRGIDIELSSGEGADKVMAAVLSGGIDIGFAGPEASIYVYNEGREDYPRVFAQVTQRDGSFLVGREDGDFQWSDLKGKVLLPGRKGGVPYMTLCYVLKQNGLTPGVDITLDDSVQFAAMAGAFTGGTGDYVSLFEPTASIIEQEGRGHIVASIGAESGEIPYTAYFASGSYLEENSDLVQDFVDAIYEGQQFVATHTAEEIAKAIAPSFPDTDMELLTAAIQNYKDIDAYCTDPILDQEPFERLQMVMTEAGELVKTAPHDKLVDNSFAEKAVKNGK